MRSGTGALIPSDEDALLDETRSLDAFFASRERSYDEAPLLDAKNASRLQSEQLQAELDKLDVWLATQPFHPAYDNVLSIRKKLRSALAHSYYLTHYTNDAIAVNAALAVQDDATLVTLKHRADIAMGAPSPHRKAMGAGMMLLGISLLVLATLVITTTLACSFPLAGFFLLLGGTASFVMGFGFFRAGLQCSMAKELDNLHTKLAS